MSTTSLPGITTMIQIFKPYAGRTTNSSRLEKAPPLPMRRSAPEEKD
jgi:hypothetical protein